MTALTAAEQAELMQVAEALADAAARETLRHFRVASLTTDSKSADFDPVTEADRAAERAMRAVLAERRPDDAILGEEYAATEGRSGLIWVLDPIDGTRAYISGAPTWGTLIAVGTEAGPFFGIVDQPFIGERFRGGFGSAQVDGPRGVTKLATLGARPLNDAILFTTFPEVGSAEERQAFEAVAGAVRLTRYGMDCYAYALLAAGQIDLVIEAGLQPYDIQAPLAVIEAAGGLVTDWMGGPAHRGGRVLAAANPAVHAEALELLRRVTG